MPPMSDTQRHPSFPVHYLTQLAARQAGATSPALLTAAGALLTLQRQRHEAFVSTLAHELRQPLSALLNAVEILRVGQDPAGSGRAVEIIQRQARHMSRLVEDVLEATRWARGTTVLQRQLVDVRQLIAETASDVAAAVSARGHALEVSSAAEPLWVDADPARLRQVLSNLLDNAIKFTEPGGRIGLAASRVGMDAVVVVSDTGRGFESRDLTHIFDLFSQVQPVQGRGLGIGLNIAHEIVTLHKGRIEARSDGPSRGSEFVVTLPTIDNIDLRVLEVADQVS
jgi:signal transduction histidine kinase